jgi:HEAT repeat protein/beta-lactamase regulating signal transducer with metallopeptidase domain
MTWTTFADAVAGMSAFPLVSDVLLKATALLVAASIAALLLRRATAAVRHLAWSLALAGLIALPLLAVSMPVQLRVLPARTGISERGSGIRERMPRSSVADPSAETEIATETEIASGNTVRSSITPSADFSPFALLVIVWSLGAAFVLGRFILGMVVVGRVVRYSRPLDEEWATIIERGMHQVGVTTPFEIRRSDAVAMPFAYGVFRPTIVLPAASDTWSAARREAVILHELAHVSRGDLLMNMLSNVACAAYWFHPLVWMAAHRLRVEGERASDDTVIITGARPSDYAEHLLHIVHSVRDSVPAGALAMARRSDFEGRLLAILEPGIRRGRLTRLGKAGVVSAFLLGVLPLAAMAPAAPSVGGADTATLNSEFTPLEQSTSTRVDSTRTTTSVSATATSTISRNSNAQGGGMPGAVGALIEILRDENVAVRVQAVKSLGALDDPRAIAALSRALKEDADARVRETAAWALGEIDDSRAVPALIDALKTERVPAVREKIVWALGEIDDPSAIEAIVAVLKDPSVGIRRQAVWALGEIDEPSAVPALLTMVRDTDIEVRRQVAWALGELESPSAIDALMILAKDADAEVRQHAVEALGQLEDERTLPALVVALKDANSDVRQHAANAIGDIDNLKAAPSALIAALADTDREVRKQVIQALANLEDPAAVPGLKRATADSDTEIRRAAVEALSEIGGTEAIEALMGLLKDPDPEVRRIVAEALGNKRR